LRASWCDDCAAFRICEADSVIAPHCIAAGARPVLGSPCLFYGLGGPSSGANGVRAHPVLALPVAPARQNKAGGSRPCGRRSAAPLGEAGAGQGSERRRREGEGLEGLRGGGEPDRPDAVAPTGCGGAAGGGGERNRSSLRQTRSMSAGMGWDVGGFEGGEGRRRAKLPSRHAREHNAGRAQLRAGARA
jgi:hypothetical protein